MPSRFGKPEVRQLARDYHDLVHEIASQLLRTQEYNLKSQIARGETSLTRNMAGVSTS